jgi:GST-like protein
MAQPLVRRDQGGPATVRAYQRAKEINTEPTVSSEEARRILFGQTAAVVKS